MQFLSRISTILRANAKNTPIDWREKGAVTPAKDQGPLGFCGTFGRTAAAEGQFAIHNHELRNFSEEELIDCIGWDQDQFSYFAEYGYMDMSAYPYIPNGTTTDEPPIPGKPCKYDAKQAIPGTLNGAFTNVTGQAPSEDQLVAFLFHNGPVNTGINANVFGLREKNCESTKDCFIAEEMCNDPTIKSQPIDHSITLVGYGTDDTKGDYWIVKNSWSEAFANDGFIKVARGISCAHIDCCGWVPTYGDVDSYYSTFCAPVLHPAYLRKTTYSKNIDFDVRPSYACFVLHPVSLFHVATGRDGSLELS